MTDLFGGSPPSTKRSDKSVPKVELPPNDTSQPPAPSPIFGTAEWDRCPCGGWAVYFFPLSGGIRRCGACAAREGRMREFPKR